MSVQNDNFDKIQGEISNLIKNYDTTLDSYISNIEKDDKNQAKQDLSNIRKINDKLLALVSKSKEMMNTYIISNCLLYTSPSPRDFEASRMPSSA